MKRYILLFLILILGISVYLLDFKKKLSNHQILQDTNQKKQWLSIDYARGFQVEYQDDYKVVTVREPWLESQEIFQYLLIPKESDIPKGYPNALVVRIPVSRIVLLSSTHLPLIEKLDLVDKVVGFSDFKYLTPIFAKRAQVGLIKEVGQMASPDLETLVAMGTDLVITYGTGDPEKDSYPKIIELGIPTAINAEYMESHPLGRFEWIKFVAAFFNEEDKAQRVFDQTKKKYEKLVSRVSQMKTRPTVLAGENYRGIFYAPASQSYMAQLIKDAGGNYIWRGDPSRASRRMDLESIVVSGNQADFWVSHGLYKSLDDLTQDIPQAKGFKSVLEKRVYANNRPIEGKPFNDYWTRALSNPDLHLTDLIRIFHPHLAPEGPFQWYQQLK